VELHLDDEIVVCMTASDWNRLLTILQDAYTSEKHAGRADVIAGLVKRLAHNADKLTMSWLAKKLAEFP
jgi:hypothetical protein